MFFNWFIIFMLLLTPVAILGKEIMHKIQSGDQLMIISNQYYGTHQRWMEIAEANPHINPNALSTGQEIRIPDPSKIADSSFMQKQRLYKSIAKLKYEKSRLLLEARAISTTISSNQNLNNEKALLAAQITQEKKKLQKLRTERNKIASSTIIATPIKLSQKQEITQKQIKLSIEKEHQKLKQILRRQDEALALTKQAKLDITSLSKVKNKLTLSIENNKKKHPLTFTDDELSTLEDQKGELNSLIEKERLALRDMQSKQTDAEKNLNKTQEEINILSEKRKHLILAIDRSKEEHESIASTDALKTHHKLSSSIREEREELQRIILLKEKTLADTAKFKHEISSLREDKENLNEIIQDKYEDAHNKFNTQQKTMLAREGALLRELQAKNATLSKQIDLSATQLTNITTEHDELSHDIQNEKRQAKFELESKYQEKVAAFEASIDQRIKDEKKLITEKLENELEIHKDQILKNNKREISRAVKRERNRLSKARDEAEDEASHYDKIYSDKIFSAQKNITRKVVDVTRRAQIKIDEAKEQQTKSQHLYNELKAKHDTLETEFFILRDANNRNREELLSFQEKESDFKFWSDERKVLLSEVAQAQSALQKKLKETNILENKIPFYRDSILAKSQEQVIREKNRILSQRLWIEKNRDFQQCTLNFPEKETLRRDTFKEMVVYLNGMFGESNILIDANSTELLIKMPGKIIYGVDTPKINSKYKKMLSKLSQSLNILPVDGIHILGISGHKFVTSESRKKISAEHFSLKQSLTLHNYFIDEMGWSPRKLSSGTLGYTRQRFLKNSKQFHLHIRFKDRSQKRSIASITSDPALDQILDDIAKELHEPKYSLFRFNDGILEVHLARHYFFSHDNFALTNAGKKKIDILIKMFMNIDDSKLQVTWVPGQLEKDRMQNIRYALSGIDQLKKYVMKKYDWTQNQIEFQFKNRHNTIIDAVTERADRKNRRLIFKLVPNRIALREVNEL